MVDAPDESRPGSSVEEDRDRADFTWAVSALRRLRRGDGAAATGGADRSAAPEPAPSEVAGPVALPPAEITDTGDGVVAVGPPAPLPAEPTVRNARAEWFVAARQAYAVPLAVVTLIGIVAMINHFSGVDWGDDFALYMRQAKSLTIGNISEVIADNHFAVDNSGWHTFSPYVYPWGWPLLVSPFFAVWGLDYDRIKVLEVAALCAFLFLYYVLVRRRTGPVPAMILMLLIGLSPSFVGATDTVLSDLPYLCFVGLSFWWMDRVRITGILEAGRRQLVALGLLLAFTYNVRREGIALLVAVAALQAAAALRMVGRGRSVRAFDRAKARNLALPYATFALAVVVFQLLLPTVMFPTAPGSGLSNISARFAYNRDVLAEHVGLKDFGRPMELFHSHAVASKALTLLLVLAVIGLLGRLVDQRDEDAGLAAYLCASSFLMLVSPYEASRYLFTITPLLVYFAYQALPTMVEVAGLRGRIWRPIAAVVPALALLGLVLLNAADLKRSTDYHRVYHYTINGPEDPGSQEMFAAVTNVTRARDVILFFRARAMTLYSDRPAIQGSDLDLMLKRVDWYVMAKNSTYSQTPVTDAEAAVRGLTKTWENANWVIWRVPPRA